MKAIVMELNTKACFINNDEETPVLNKNIPQFINLTKLDGVGPVDNRPSTDKLQHFVKKKEEKKRRKKIVTCDT